MLTNMLSSVSKVRTLIERVHVWCVLVNLGRRLKCTIVRRLLSVVRR